MKERSSRILDWIARSLLLLLVVASPWPFGSVAPRAASTLAAALFVLYAAHAAVGWLRDRSPAPPHGGLWIASGLALAAFQSLPLPSAITAIAPGVGRAYSALENELGAVSAWHPLSIEPFRTEWSFLQLLSLACAFHLANRLFRRTADRAFLAASLAAVGVAPDQPLPGLNLMDIAKSGGQCDRKSLFGEIFDHDVADIDRPAASL